MTEIVEGSDQIKALLSDFTGSKGTFDYQSLEVGDKSTDDEDDLKHQALNDSLASNDSFRGVERTWERFWVLFLFGCSTCVNACGWISVAPVFMLVEDVSINGIFHFLNDYIDCYFAFQL